jgi:hypothetical protein
MHRLPDCLLQRLAFRAVSDLALMLCFGHEVTVRMWYESGHCPKLLTRDEARGLQRISSSRRSCCGGHRHLKPVSATTRAEKRDLASVHNTTRGASYALVHACAVRSCRADRDSCALCSVPSRRLSVAGKRGTCQISQGTSYLARHQPLLDIRSAFPTTSTCGRARAFPTTRTGGRAFHATGREMSIFAV